MGLARYAALLSLAWCGACAAAGPVTYDFTGVVTSETLDAGVFSPVPVGAVVTGTLTFNYYAAASIGTVGSTFFDVNVISGAQNNSPSMPLLFSSTATVDGLTYRSNSQATYLSESDLRGGQSFIPPGLTGSEVTQASASSRFLGSDVNFASYSSAGLPVFSATSAGSGDFLTGYLEGLGQREVDVDMVNYNITSLTLASAVPEAPAATTLAAGLSLLSLLAWRRQRPTRVGRR